MALLGCAGVESGCAPGTASSAPLATAPSDASCADGTSGACCGGGQLATGCAALVLLDSMCTAAVVGTAARRSQVGLVSSASEQHVCASHSSMTDLHWVHLQAHTIFQSVLVATRARPSHIGIALHNYTTPRAESATHILTASPRPPGCSKSKMPSSTPASFQSARRCGAIS